MINFLAQQRKLLNSSNKLQIILGNSSADFDSTFGSILFAFQSFLIGRPCISVINQKKNLFEPLISEMIEKQIGFNVDDMIFKDEFMKQKDSLQYFDIVLFDHNKLDHEWSNFIDRVIGIIDHHEDTKFSFKNLTFKQIEYTGSAITLVAEKLTKIDEQIAKMIMLTIIHDSFYFEKSMKNNLWTDRDFIIFEKMFLYCKNFEKDKIWEKIRNQKYSIELNLQQSLSTLLQRDFKEMGEGGFSSLNIKLGNLFQKYTLQSLEQQIQGFSHQSKLKFLLVLFNFYENNEFKKELLFFSEDTNIIKYQKIIFLIIQSKFKKIFQKENYQEIILECDFLYYYNYINSEHTRKDIISKIFEVNKYNNL